MDGGQNVCPVTAGAYVKVKCGLPTAIGNIVRVNDGGPANVCTLADGGSACDIFKFTDTTERYFSQLLPTQNGVVLVDDGGVNSCAVFAGK